MAKDEKFCLQSANEVVLQLSTRNDRNVFVQIDEFVRHFGIKGAKSFVVISPVVFVYHPRSSSNL